MQVMITHAVKVRNNLSKLNTSLSSVGYPQELIILIFKLYEWYISSLFRLNVIEYKGKEINYNAYNGLKCPLKLISGALLNLFL